MTPTVRSSTSFALGVALTIAAAWGFAAWRANAAVGSNESTFVPVVPVRVLDTRDPVNVGLNGPFVSPTPQDLRITGAIPTTTGTQVVVPAGATGVAMNVTVVSPNANGFLSIRPADAPGSPTTSSLNFNAGDIVPNAVDVPLPTTGADAGKIEITFDAYGTAGRTTDVLVDVVGYYTNSGLQSLQTEVSGKANAADVYTKAQVDAKFATQGTITLGAGSWTSESGSNFSNGCVQNTTSPYDLEVSLPLPVGVTITAMTAFVYDNDGAANALTRLHKLTNNNDIIASVSTVGTGLQNRSVTLATPEVVDPNEYFYVEYLPPAGNALHLVCGVSITYTVGAGTSILSTDDSTTPIDATSVGTADD